MELIQPVRQSQLMGQTATIKHAPSKRLLLVDPYPRNNPYRLTAAERRTVWFPKLSLPTIAAYTPANWEVNLVDEAVHDIDFDFPCDMVGLSMFTCYAPRAYEIAAEFRKRGKTIVMGGVHPTYCPDEALQHADAIVCGEAEDLWPQLVADYEAGKMQRMYKMTSFPSLENYKSPRVDLLSPDSYMTRQCSFTTRGCHFDCEFCSVSPFNGKTTRRRPVKEVITELRNVQRWIRSELIERVRDEPMWKAFLTTLKIRVGMEELDRRAAADRPLDVDRRRLAERDLDAELVCERRLDDLLLDVAVERDGDLAARVVLPDVDQRILLGELRERDA